MFSKSKQSVDPREQAFRDLTIAIQTMSKDLMLIEQRRADSLIAFAAALTAALKTLGA